MMTSEKRIILLSGGDSVAMSVFPNKSIGPTDAYVILQFSENDDWEEISKKLNRIRTMAGIIDPTSYFPPKLMPAIG